MQTINKLDKKELDSKLISYMKAALENMREELGNNDIDCITEEKAITILEVSKSTIQRMRKRGELKGKKLGKRYYYTRENLRKAIKPD